MIDRDKFNILCEIYLEDLEHQPSSTLYNVLSPLFKAAYNNSDRFIFHNYLPVKSTTLDHVVHILQYIDISPYFIVILTNQNTTKQYFSALPEPIVVYEQEPKQSHSINHKVQPVFNTNGHMCAHAWGGMHVRVSGAVSLCCNFEGSLKDSLGNEFNIRNSEINEIINSEHAKQIRQQFRQGLVPQGCKTCISKEAVGGTSKRQLAPFQLANIYGHLDWESDISHNWGFLGAHLGNLCNLKCRICDENYSSSIAVEKLQHPKIYDKDKIYAKLANHSWKNFRSEFFDLIKQTPQFKNFEFLGGETLLVKENIEFMQYLVDQGLSHNCIFEFVTNGTQYHDVFDCADKFKRLTISVSLDDIGKRFEYQRSGADWNTVVKNIKRLKSNPGLTLGVSITVNIQNIYYIPELISWLLDQGINDYYFNLLHHPTYLAIGNLPESARPTVVAKLKNSKLPAEHQQQMEFLINLVSNITYPGSSEEFKKHTAILDQLRKESFAEVHPEIAELMGFELSKQLCNQ